MTESGERGDLREALRKELEACGIDISKLSCGPDECIDLGAVIQGLDVGGPLKVICLSANLRDSVEALSDSARDNVVMVRVDEDTVNALDAWVEAGAVKSRSAAAVLPMCSRTLSKQHHYLNHHHHSSTLQRQGQLHHHHPNHQYWQQKYPIYLHLTHHHYLKLPQ